MDFRVFYCDHIADFGLAESVELFRVIEETVAADADDNNPVANALRTCFLEDISSSEVGEASKSLMGPSSRAYFDFWHVWPSGPAIGYIDGSGSPSER
ncbi:hypothetical protein BVG79_00887 [Ketogulonicigenium robustum]|uniref:Uncharacterized protein n=2 Tax=Ketogulonicigenium robustum TaxID=92947 RepID=A0A1W6NYH9_9RHOB|nr:hypothetical protein BVG79_00887 [Ketogulonicigenium robustum]